MNDIYETLKKFGLTKNEIKVYLETLKHKETSPFSLSKPTGIPRTTVYDVVMGLSLKGLVELEQSDGFKKQQTRIKAKNPSVFRNILQQKREDLLSLELDVLNFLPDLKSDFHKEKVNANFQFYPGIEGARKVYTEEIDVDLPIYAWDMQMPMDVFGSEVINELVLKETNLRLKRGSKYVTKEITPINDWTKHVLSYQYSRSKDYLKEREIRGVDSPIFEIYQRISLKGNWIMITCTKEDEVWGLRINSPLLAKSMYSIFQLNWQVATPITEELVKSWGEDAFAKEERKRNN